MAFQNDLFCENSVKNNNNYEGTNLSSLSFFHKSFKRSTFSNVQIIKKTIAYCAFTGSQFNSDCFFVNKMSNCNLQNCKFFKLDFSNINMIFSSTFDNSVFYDCIFNDLVLLSCNFTHAMFINCKFDKIYFKSSNFDNCLFEGCSFVNLEFINMNIDYAIFKHTEIKNSVLAPFQLPYIYGFEEIIKCQENHVIINNNKYTINEYIDNLNYMLEFFEQRQEYFPIINIYCFFKEYKKANEIAKLSCTYNLSIGHFTQLKKLLKLCNAQQLLTYHDRKELLVMLNSSTREEYEILEYNECKKLLLDNITPNSIMIDTGLDYNDPDFIELVKELDSYLSKEEKDGFHLIKYTHKSPVLLELTYVDFVGIISGAITIGTFLTPFIKKLFSKIKKQKETHPNMLYPMPKKVVVTSIYNENGVLIKKIEEIYQ